MFYIVRDDNVSLFCCSAVLLFCCSAVLLFCCSAVLLFCCSAVLLFCCSYLSTDECIRASSAGGQWIGVMGANVWRRGRLRACESAGL
ncbi:hypothetical protein [Aeromonas caviae]|uniref:hypothetical protein n=1 Tax=Aeromonas caviae TaxID=648 RepID=UPI0023AA9D28|nr:hypothetical protein [Aeromonas caviae]WEE23722.1 hypothetical protein PY772_09830 [Aeromonas caviae]